MHLLFFLLLLFLPPLHARTIPYPPNVQAEGVTHALGSNFFFADFRSGDIYLADAFSGLVTRAVRAPKNRTAVGLHARNNRLFAAGGGAQTGPIQPALHVYDVQTGRTIATCSVEGGVINDVVADSDFAYYTDSVLGRIYKLALDRLPRCDVQTIELPKPLFTAKEGFGASSNGIIKYKKGLIVSHFDLGTIFFVDLVNGSRLQQILPPGSMPGADGLDIDRKKGGSLLFVAQNALNLVSMWRLGIDDNRKVSAAPLMNFTSPQLGFPTTVAVTEEYVVATSSRFDEVDFTKPIPKNVTLSLVVFRRG